MSEYPDFRVVCVHRHGGAATAFAACYRWQAARGVWEPTDESKVITGHLEGDEIVRGGEGGGWHNPPPGRLRQHHEIKCGMQGCKVPPFQIDADALQDLFAVVATNRDYRRAYTMKVARRQITVTLEQLDTARTAWNDVLRKADGVNLIPIDGESPTQPT